MPELNNDKNVYILGAGFSKEIGLPLQDDFLLIAREVFSREPVLFKHFETVFKYQNKLTKMKKYLNYPLLNLEHLFNLIEMDAFYSNNDALAEIKSDFTRLICDVLIDKTPFPFSRDRSEKVIINDIFKPYLSFASLLVRDDREGLILHKDTVINFNYDLVLEGAAYIYNFRRHKVLNNRHGSITFNTMLDNKNITRLPVSECFIKNRPDPFFPSITNLFSESNESVKLIKLHGSINWKNNEDDKTFIIPPTWNKSDPQIKSLWDNAYQELKTAKRIIVIGYSFPETDIYVKSLLALAINENEILQNIYFVNPDEDVAKRTSISLLDKYFEKYCSYKPWRFSYLFSTPDGKKFIEESLNRKISMRL